MAELEFVCNDPNGDTVWKYDPSEKKYVRFNQAGEVVAMIAGQYIPNPEALWDNRRKIAAVNSTTNTAALRLKPQAATYALWEHWQKVNENADTNN